MNWSKEEMKLKESNNSKSSIPSVTEIVAGMDAVAPRSNKNNRGTSYETIATEYLLKTINELIKAKEVGGLKEIYINNISFEYRYKNGKRWYSYLRDNYPLFMMIHPGINMPNASSPSKVKSLHSDIELLEYRMNQDFSSLYEWNSDVDTLDVPVDMDNLHNYIADCYVRISRANDSNQRYVKKLVKNAGSALHVFDCAKANGDVMRQSYAYSDFGRLYMKGINLQNGIGSEVREAALGKCYKYDISSASYAFRLGYIKTVCPSAKTPALFELVEQKKHIRNKLVKECLTNTNADDHTKLKIIKGALNAIGFGAKLDVNSNGLKDSIYSYLDRKQFIEHNFIQELKIELNQFTQLLKEEIPNKRAKALMPTTQKRFSARALESYVYQRIETSVMENVMQNTKADVIMWCHDAIYTRKREGVGNLNYYLHQQQYMQYASFEEEELSTWRNPFKHAESVQGIGEHNKRIKAEENTAQELANDN
jgi:hypothetical protein